MTEATAETATTIVDMEIVMTAIEIVLADMAETDTTIVGPEIGTVGIDTAEIAMVEIAMVNAIGVEDLAETVTTIAIVGLEIVNATMIAEVVIVMAIEIGDVTTMSVIMTVIETVTMTETRGVTVTVVGMQEVILIETRGNQVRK